MEDIYDLVIVGGGAAGFFGAIQVATLDSTMRILILEKTSKLLSKVKISGGGRCNVTHHCFESSKLAAHYPRGEKQIKQLFRKFQAKDAVNWFASKGVSLKSEEDGRMFPTSDNSQTIIDCFLKETSKQKIQIEINRSVVEIAHVRQRFEIICKGDQKYQAKKILIAIGGSANSQAYHWIEMLGHTIASPIPSLFTFNDSGKEFKDLMGVSVSNAQVKIAGTKFSESGPVLITHWGLSGPAVIKLSAWAAEYLHENQYQFTALVSWIGAVNEDEIRGQLNDQKKQKGKQRVISNTLFGLPSRLWQRLCELAAIDEQKIWSELPQKNINRLIEFLIRCPFSIKGKTTFKEEFVTCGGVELSEIDPETMESKKVKNIFFAGEVLHIDGETGGFNFQAAWTTAFIAANSIAKK